VAPDQLTDLGLLVGIEKPAMPRRGSAGAALQPGRTALGEALADVEHPGPGQAHLRRDRVVGHTRLPQADDLPPALLLRRGRQLAHVHMLHPGQLGMPWAVSTSPRPDQ
jgi:hypothetical protein